MIELQTDFTWFLVVMDFVKMLELLQIVYQNNGKKSKLNDVDFVYKSSRRHIQKVVEGVDEIHWMILMTTKMWNIFLLLVDDHMSYVIRVNQVHGAMEPNE